MIHTALTLDEFTAVRIVGMVRKHGRLTLREFRYKVGCKTDRLRVLGLVGRLAAEGRLTLAEYRGTGSASFVMSAPGLSPGAVTVLGNVKCRGAASYDDIAWLTPSIAFDEVVADLITAGYLTEIVESNGTRYLLASCVE